METREIFYHDNIAVQKWPKHEKKEKKLEHHLLQRNGHTYIPRPWSILCTWSRAPPKFNAVGNIRLQSCHPPPGSSWFSWWITTSGPNPDLDTMTTVIICNISFCRMDIRNYNPPSSTRIKPIQLVDHNITAYSQSRHHDNHLHSFICYVGFCRIDVRNCNPPSSTRIKLMQLVDHIISAESESWCHDNYLCFRHRFLQNGRKKLQSATLHQDQAISVGGSQHHSLIAIQRPWHPSSFLLT